MLMSLFIHLLGNVPFKRLGSVRCFYVFERCHTYQMLTKTSPAYLIKHTVKVEIL